jgi:hypothetical protein
MRLTGETYDNVRADIYDTMEAQGLGTDLLNIMDMKEVRPNVYVAITEDCYDDTYIVSEFDMSQKQINLSQPYAVRNNYPEAQHFFNNC